jgi:hypothetical protein
MFVKNIDGGNSRQVTGRRRRGPVSGVDPVNAGADR